MKPKPTLYVSPKAPEWIKDMLREVFPTGNEVSAEEMERKLDAQRELRDLSDRSAPSCFGGSTGLEPVTASNEPRAGMKATREVARR